MSVDVRGGVGGLEVQYDELAGWSDRLAADGADLLVLAADRHRLLLDGDLLASAVLASASFARAEGALLDALDGSDGLIRAGVGLECRAGQLLLAVARYRASDVLGGQADAARRWLTLAGVPALVGGGLARISLAAVRGDDPAAELQELLSEHPGVVDDGLRLLTDVTAPLGAGLLGPLPTMADQAFRARTGEALLPRDVAEAAGLLALLYAPGRPVHESRTDTADDAVLAPRGVGDLLRRLEHRNDEARGSARQGDIGVTRLASVGPDGRPSVAWVVDLPGTKDWQLDPAQRAGLNDLASNLELMAGHENARVQALERALAEAGAVPGQPVMLVGHSQGGMVAMRAAQELAGRLDVTHVVTAGSPVGVMRPPPGVQVLSLENRRDLVPHTDGAENPDADEHVTVLFDRQADGGLGGEHGLHSAYVPAARALDRSADASVRAWLDSAEDFLAGPGERVTATTTVFSISNDTDGDGEVDDAG